MVKFSLRVCTKSSYQLYNCQTDCACVSLVALSVFVQGFGALSKLRMIMLYTLDRRIRDYLLSELKAAGVLSADDVNAGKWACRIEQMYSNPSIRAVRHQLETLSQHQG